MRLYILSIMLLIVVHAQAESNLKTIELHETCNVSDEIIHLSDIATLLPVEAATEVAQLEIGPSPASGEQRILTLGYLRSRLRRLGLNLTDITITGSPKVCVTAFADEATASEKTASALPRASHTSSSSATVRSGTQVKLQLRNGGLCIETTGELQGAGVIGGLVKIRIPLTRTTIQARLITSELAEVMR